SAHHVERNRFAGRGPEGRPEYGADIRAGLVEVPVVRLGPARVSEVAGGNGELGAAGGDLRVHPRLVDIERAVVDPAVGGVSPVTEHVEGQWLCATGRLQGAEVRGRVRAEQVQRAG